MEGQTYKLKHPIQFGTESITEFKLTPCGKAFKGFSQSLNADGSMHYDPFALASICVRMAGRPNAVAEMLSPADMNALAKVAMDFLGDGL